jgi:hypothetical protein
VGVVRIEEGKLLTHGWPFHQGKMGHTDVALRVENEYSDTLRISQTEAESIAILE